jgi:glycosyltransferase involved in cell wall biosynthesis
MNAPIVSVLTTVYNREKYLPECIESVLASSFRDFEYIIVDDVSTDSSYDIAREYAKQDPRIKVYRNETNLGDYPNRNQAASHASGKYLKYVDSDDIIYPHGLEVMVAAMERFPEAAYALGARSQLRGRPFPALLTPREAFLSHYVMESSAFSASPLSSIITRSAFETVGRFPEERMTSDYAMWHKLSMTYPLVLLPQGLVWYRQHESQEVSDIARNPIKFRFKYDRIASQYVHDAMRANILTLSEASQIVHRIRLRQQRDALRMLTKCQLSAAWSLLLGSFQS